MVHLERVMPTLSIILPVYNVEAYIGKCLNSILIDNTFCGEVICVNDGSTDNSFSILQQYAQRYPNVQIVSQPNAGLSVARNVGLKKATGDYVFFVDSDDWIFPHTLQQIMDKIDGEDALYFNARKVYENTQKIDENCDMQERRHSTGSAYFAAVLNERRNMPCVCVGGGVYSRKFLLSNELWNKPGIYHEDNYFTPQLLLKAQNVSSINVYVYAYRIRNNGSITSSISLKHIRDLLFISRSLYKMFSERQGVDRCFYRYISNLYTNLLYETYHNGLRLKGLWTILDTMIFVKCSTNSRIRKSAKLSYLSPKISYLYLSNNLPIVLRKVINRFV